MVILTSFPIRGASKGPQAMTRRLSEPRASIRFATLLTFVIGVLVLAFGSLFRGRESLLIASIIGGMMIVACWAVTLFIASLILTVRFLRARGRRATPTKPEAPGVRGGVSDEWLDGPV
jgi:hypothetical protein